MSARGHGMAADWWSVGILLYEMLTGAPPFRAKSRTLLQKKITGEKIKYPPFLGAQAHKLLQGLLQRDEARRLGAGPTGAAAVQQHDFFKGLNWKRLLAKEIPAPFRPAVAGDRCTANFDEMWTSMPALDSPTSTPEAAEGDPFQGYTYCRESHLGAVEAELLQRTVSALGLAEAQAAADAVEAAEAGAGERAARGEEEGEAGPEQGQGEAAGGAGRGAEGDAGGEGTTAGDAAAGAGARATEDQADAAAPADPCEAATTVGDAGPRVTFGSSPCGVVGAH